MQKLFTKRFDSTNSVIKPPAFELIRRIYQRQIDTITDYYHSRVIGVPSNHLLCRLLTTANVPFQYDVDRYMEAAYARSPYVGKYFNLTSEINYGRFNDGVFYGPGNDELLLYDESYFNPYDALLQWKTLSPVKVLEHPISDFGLKLPDGRSNSTATGLSVVSIDIPLLLLQYRGFVMEQYGRIIGGEAGQLATSHFVHMYVLPGMIKSHIDLVIMNRLKNLYYGAPMSQATTKHPFQVIDYGSRVDRVLLDVLKHIENKSTLYSTSLKSIPSVYGQDMQDALMVPDMSPTRQVWWALILTRLSTASFLLDVGGKEGVRSNGDYLNKYQLIIKQLERDSVLASVLPSERRHDTLATFEEILTL